MAAANLAGYVENELRALLPDGSPAHMVSDVIFLPYRDSKQTEIVGKDRAQRIFIADIERLAGSSCLLARLDGLAKDTGVTMEIGYAHALGIPVGLLVTDFMWEGCLDNETEWFLDPVLSLMADVCSTVPAAAPLASCYYQTNLLHEHEAVRSFVKECLNAFHIPRPLRPRNTKPRKPQLAFVDIMGGRYEWARLEADRISKRLARLGYKVHTAGRYASLPNADIKKLTDGSCMDIRALKQADVAIFSGDGPEMEAGSSALFGFAKAMGVITVFQYTSRICYKGIGGQTMRINLMVDQASDIITGSTQETVNILEALKEEK